MRNIFQIEAKINQLCSKISSCIENINKNIPKNIPKFKILNTNNFGIHHYIIYASDDIATNYPFFALYSDTSEHDKEFRLDISKSLSVIFEYLNEMLINSKARKGYSGPYSLTFNLKDLSAFVNSNKNTDNKLELEKIFSKNIYYYIINNLDTSKETNEFVSVFCDTITKLIYKINMLYIPKFYTTDYYVVGSESYKFNIIDETRYNEFEGKVLDKMSHTLDCLLKLYTFIYDIFGEEYLKV